MRLSPHQQQAADSLRRIGMGDRRIADALDLTYHTVRKDREQRLGTFDPEQAAAEGGVPGFRQVVIVSDTQHPHAQDDSACELVRDFIEDKQPDKVIQIGDFIDLYSVSRFLKRLPPSERPSLWDEIEETRNLAKWWHSAAPDAEWVILEGNHEQRLQTYLETHAEELMEFPDLRLEHLLGFDELGINYVGPYGAGVWVGQEDGLWATHGDYARKHSGYSARAQLEAVGSSVIHGHTHRLGAFYQTNMGGTYAGFEVGCLCRPEKTPPFRRNQNWQLGFANVWVSDHSPRFHVDLVAITDGGFVYGGERYGR